LYITVKSRPHTNICIFGDYLWLISIDTLALVHMALVYCPPAAFVSSLNAHFRLSASSNDGVNTVYTSGLKVNLHYDVVDGNMH